MDGDSRTTDIFSGDSESNRSCYWIFSTVAFSLDKHIAPSKRHTYPIEVQACRSLYVATCGSSAMERPSARLVGLVSMAMQKMPNPLPFSCTLLTFYARRSCNLRRHLQTGQPVRPPVACHLGRSPLSKYCFQVLPEPRISATF